MIWWHRLRGHLIQPYRAVVTTPTDLPWRWQCTCGRTWGPDR